ncbi:MAG: fructose-bisphosphatase class III [Candidatus Omnitrophica bacterium]|nr:fructose-bisphosphatase class III [Candidatus Omnitrophota bacterium]
MCGRQKTYVIGDIHGTAKALAQCLQRAGFDYARDRLILLGDVCDRYPDARQCIDEMLKIKECDLVLGNHDLWVLAWSERGEIPEMWLRQGGAQTIASYGGGPMPRAHIDFLKRGRLWLERGDQLFVHAGFNPELPLSSQSVEDFVWNRGLFMAAWEKQAAGQDCRFGPYKDIFIGHTPSSRYESLQPLHACNIWNLDTGAGWSGKLTIMDVDSKQYWQSDVVTELYGAQRDMLER